jgi:hypothetical protein
LNRRPVRAKRLGCLCDRGATRPSSGHSRRSHAADHAPSVERPAHEGRYYRLLRISTEPTSTWPCVATTFRTTLGAIGAGSEACIFGLIAILVSTASSASRCASLVAIPSRGSFRSACRSGSGPRRQRGRGEAARAGRSASPAEVAEGPARAGLHSSTCSSSSASSSSAAPRSTTSASPVTPARLRASPRARGRRSRQRRRMVRAPFRFAAPRPLWRYAVCLN